jgi:hypothetical protein
MGNVNFPKTCCNGNNKTDVEFKDVYLSKYANSSSINKIIKLQSFFRMYRIIRKLRLSGKHRSRSRNNINRMNNVPSSIFNNEKDKNTNQLNQLKQFEQDSSLNYDLNLVPGVLLDPSAEKKFINQKIAEIEKNLGPFHMNEKESYIISFSNLKKYAIFYQDNSFYKGFFNKLWQKEGFGV